MGLCLYLPKLSIFLLLYDKRWPSRAVSKKSIFCDREREKDKICVTSFLKIFVMIYHQSFMHESTSTSKRRQNQNSRIFIILAGNIFFGNLESNFQLIPSTCKVYMSTSPGGDESVLWDPILDPRNIPCIPV